MLLDCFFGACPCAHPDCVLDHVQWHVDLRVERICIIQSCIRFSLSLLVVFFLKSDFDVQHPSSSDT
jgi:hypothetical protein